MEKTIDSDVGTFGIDSVWRLFYHQLRPRTRDKVLQDGTLDYFGTTRREGGGTSGDIGRLDDVIPGLRSQGLTVSDTRTTIFPTFPVHRKNYQLVSSRYKKPSLSPLGPNDDCKTDRLVLTDENLNTTTGL